MNDPKIYLSVVVPIFNEEGNVVELHQQILDACEKLGHKFEIIFIDDGSSDDSFKNMEKLSPLKIIKFRKNFGQTAALDAGIKESVGELVVTMDGDLQNDPADIPKLIEKLDEGYDVVSGWRKNRKDTFMKKFVSRGAKALRRVLINDGIHDSGCTLKIYKQECFNGVDLFGEMHRFIPALLKLKGFKIGEVVVNHRLRTSGVTKYGVSRAIKGFLDMLSVWFWKKFANRPLHLFGGFGLFLILVSFCATVYAAYMKLFGGLDLSDTLLSTLAMLTFVGGVQFLVFGLLADMLSKNYYASTGDRAYDIEFVSKNQIIYDRHQNSLHNEAVVESFVGGGVE